MCLWDDYDRWVFGNDCDMVKDGDLPRDIVKDGDTH